MSALLNLKLLSEKQKEELDSKEKVVLQEYGYTISKIIGKGSYGRVYYGRFSRNKDKPSIPLACKVIDLVGAEKERYVSKFLPRELEILSKIKHPHIVKVHSIFKSQNKCYVFMRYAELGDLDMFLRARGALQEDQARIWARQIALAVQYLHALEIAHRDIKAKNILITQRMNTKLTDFGFSRVLVNELGLPEMSLTFCGTAPYLSPEILKRIPYKPKKADMWALGCVLFLMMTRVPPFGYSAKGDEMLNKQLREDWIFPEKRKVSEQMKTAIRSLLQVKVEKRWSVSQLLQSDWIAMDPKLKVMDKEEYDALIAATEQTRIYKKTLQENQKRASSRRSGKLVSRNFYGDIKFYKQQSLGFHIDTIRSKLNFARAVLT